MKISQALFFLRRLHELYKIEELKDNTYSTTNKINALTHGDYNHELLAILTDDDCELMANLLKCKKRWKVVTENDLDDDLMIINAVWSTVIDDLIKLILIKESYQQK